MRRALTGVFAALVLVLLDGCGGDAGRTPAGELGKLALEDFALMLKGLPGDKLKPPTKQSELDPLEPAAPIGIEALKEKRIVYLWGGGYVPGGTRVVAYETKAESEGGYVLFEDGTVKTMSAEDLKAAPKAGKK